MAVFRTASQASRTTKQAAKVAQGIRTTPVLLTVSRTTTRVRPVEEGLHKARDRCRATQPPARQCNIEIRATGTHETQDSDPKVSQQPLDSCLSNTSGEMVTKQLRDDHGAHSYDAQLQLQVCETLCKEATTPIASNRISHHSLSGETETETEARCRTTPTIAYPQSEATRARDRCYAKYQTNE